MEKVAVSKKDLLKTLRRNKNEHEKQYTKALEKYREKLIEELNEKLERAMAGKTVKHQFLLPIPENFTDRFQTAIEMLEWEVGDIVELDQQDFARYIQNRWEWNERFLANTGSYLK